MVRAPGSNWRCRICTLCRCCGEGNRVSFLDSTRQRLLSGTNKKTPATLHNRMYLLSSIRCKQHNRISHGHMVAASRTMTSQHRTTTLLSRARTTLCACNCSVLPHSLTDAVDE